MKANELMIGDWVFIDHCSNRIEPCFGQVKGIDKNGEDVYTTDGMVDISLLKPIPLTSEILEQNGFCLRDVDLYNPIPAYVWCMDGERNDTVIEITFYNPAVRGVKALVKIQADPLCGGGVNKIHNCDIEYVHQLQHALRLCGIEKEFVI